MVYKSDMSAPESAHPVSGLSPEQWEAKLQTAAKDPKMLPLVLKELEQEMQQEQVWLHENPTPGKFFRALFHFLDDQDDHDYEKLALRLQDELKIERWLKKRFRTWLPGETFQDRLYSYIKEFAAPIKTCSTGFQFPDFDKYKGIKSPPDQEAMVFYLNHSFPGREPANFHVQYDCDARTLILKRAYKMELPRIPIVRTVGRAILAELIQDIISDLSVIQNILVDNAANQKTRAMLIQRIEKNGQIRLRINPLTSPEQTPIGHLVKALASDLGIGLKSLKAQVSHFGILQLCAKTA